MSLTSHINIKELKTNILLNPQQAYNNRDQNIKNALFNNEIGSCHKSDGLVVDILQIISRSSGMISEYIPGHVSYEVVFLAKVIRPVKDTVLRNCEITQVNKVGIVAKDLLNMDNNNSGIIVIIPSKYLPSNYQNIYTNTQKINAIVNRAQYGMNDTLIYAACNIYYYPTLNDLMPRVLIPFQNELNTPDIDVKYADEYLEPDIDYGYDYKIEIQKDKIEAHMDTWSSWRTVGVAMEMLLPYHSKADGSLVVKGRANSLYIESYGPQVPNEKVISRAYFKMYEMCYQFGLVSKEGSIKIASIAEGPGGFIQAISNFRQKNNLIHKNDVIHAITLKETSKHLNFSPLISKLPIKVIEESGKGDITDFAVVNKFIENCGEGTCDLVTADGGILFTKENYDFQEQACSVLLLGEIATALSLQKVGGSFVCKIFGAVTKPTVEKLYLLSFFYKKISLYKPSNSRPGNSELYIICQDFSGAHPTVKSKLLNSLKNKKKYVSSICPNMELSEETLNTIKEFNQTNLESQFNQIEDILNIIQQVINLSPNRVEELLKTFNSEQIRLAIKWCEMMGVDINPFYL